MSRIFGPTPIEVNPRITPVFICFQGSIGFTVYQINSRINYQGLHSKKPERCWVVADYGLCDGAHRERAGRLPGLALGSHGSHVLELTSNWGTRQRGLIHPLTILKQSDPPWISGSFSTTSISQYEHQPYFTGDYKARPYIHSWDPCPGVSSRWRCWFGSSDMRTMFFFLWSLIGDTPQRG